MRFTKVATAAVLAGAFLAIIPVRALAWDHDGDRGRNGYYNRGYGPGYYGDRDARSDYFEHMRHERWEHERAERFARAYGYYGYNVYGYGDER